MGASFNRASTDSLQNQYAGTNIPAPFLRQFTNLFGSPIGLEQYAQLAPTTRGLFGGGDLGYGTGGGTQQGAPGGGGAAVGDGTTTAPVGAPAGQAPRRYGLQDYQAMLQNQGVNQGRIGVQSNKMAQQLRAAGIDPASFTLADIQRIQGQGPAPGGGIGGGQHGPSTRADNLASYLQTLESIQQPVPLQRVGGAQALATDAMEGGAAGAIGRLGFGAAPVPYTQPGDINAGVPTVNAQQVGGSLSNIAGGDYDRYEKALYESQFNPTARELGRQQDIQSRQLGAQLAGSGLASSGTGIGQRQQQVQDYNTRLQSASADAAHQATVQRYGAQFEETKFNALQKQQADLESAKMDLSAQQTNAGNVLQGNMANADAYLKTIGLNQQQAESARRDFLGLMNLQEDDLKRTDAFNTGILDRAMNNWLQQVAAITDAGRLSTGFSTARTRSISQSAGVLNTGGGGGE